MTLGKKLLVAFFSVVLLATVAVGGMNLFSARETIHALIEEQVQKELALIIEDTEHHFTAHESIARSAAALYTSLGDRMSKDDYRKSLENLLQMNQSTLGSGIWLEPKVYNDEKYFGPYVYKDGDRLLYTLDYEDPAYDYRTTDWYLLGKNPDGQSGWTDPYYDETTGITMITTAVPILNNQEVIGVVSADYDLTSIQDLVENVQIETTGYAFLVDKTGMIIAHHDPSIRMQTNIGDRLEYSDLVAAMASQDQEEVRLDLEGKEYIANYMTLPRTSWTLVTMAPTREIYAAIYKMSYQSVAATVVALILAVAISFILSKKIAGGIILFQKSMENLALGDFTHEYQVKTKDEIGNMGKSYNNILANLKNIMRKIIENSENVAATAQELAVSTEETGKSIVEVATSIQELANNSHEQTKVIDDMNQSIENIYEEMNDIHTHLGVTKDSVNQTQDYVGKGEDYVQQAVNQMEAINQHVQKSSTTIYALNDKSKQIEEIVAIISGISDQTNLLALNASIEAARAGEHGRGFAIVAGEVGKLAEASAKSSANIGQLIQEIQEDIVASKEVMQESKEATVHGIRIIQKTGDAFATIAQSMGDVSANAVNAVELGAKMLEEITQIREATLRIAESTSLNDMNTQNVSATTEEQTAIIEQIQTATEQLANIANELQEEVNIFKID